MKKEIFSFFCLLILCISTNAQTTITGSVADTTQDKSIKNAVIILLAPKDSVLYKFTRSDAAGNFILKNVQPGNYILMTNHPYFADIVENVTVDSKDVAMGKLMLTSKSKLLKEVIIKSGSPIKIKGDTTVYTADSFKVKDGASVEDLLRKMPGFQVGKNGELKAMGETVKNVLVDGEEFFGNDPGMVLKNLQANTVQEVQVYDKKSEQATFTGIDDGVKEKTVNLKLKNSKKQGYFGKAEVGGGTPDNYTNTAMLNAFKGKRKLSAFGFMSNTGKTGLGWQEAEKFGGGEMDGMTTNTDDEGNTWYNISRGNDAKEGIPKNWNGGVHYSNKYKGDSLNINSSYRYSKINSPGFSKTFSKTYLPDTSWGNNSVATSLNSKQNHSASFTIESKLDSNNTIKFVNKVGASLKEGNNNYYEENITNQNTFINNSTQKSSTTSNGQNYKGTLTWNHKFKKLRRTLSTNFDLTINHTDSKIFLTSINNYYKGGAFLNKDSVDQKTQNKSDTKTIGATFAYTEPLAKYLSLGVTYSVNQSKNGNNRNVLANDGNGSYVKKIDSLSNDFDFNKLVQRTGVNFRWVKKRVTASVGSAFSFNKFIQKNNTKNIRQDYDFTNYFPSANVSLKLKGNKNLRFGYNGNAQAPSLQQLQPIVDNSNPLSVSIGNSNLKQSFTNNFSGNFGWSKPLSDNSVWSNFTYSTTNNAFTQFNTVDSFGRNVYQTVNVDGNKRFNLNADYNTSIGSGKKKIGFGFGPNIEFSRNSDFINGKKNVNTTASYKLRVSLNKYVEDKFDFYLDQNFGYNKSSSSINTSSITKYWTYTGWFGGSLFLKHNLSFNSEAEFEYRQKDPRFPQNNNFITWDANVKKYVYKKEISLKLSVNDILNQNRGYERNFSTYKSTESYYNTLKRFWLLTFSWEFTHNNKSNTTPANTTTTITK